MIEVRLCRDCKWSQPERPDGGYYLDCTHPKVNSKDPWLLGSMFKVGSSCKDERENRWCSPCGMKGKLWEKKE